MIITLHGRVPSKKNSKTIVCRGKYPMLLSGPKYLEWHKDASKQIIGAYKRCLCPSEIEITIYPPDKRKSDLSNKTESVMDLLVDNNVLEDDNWFCCPYVVMKFGGVDKKNPRAVINLKIGND